MRAVAVAMVVAAVAGGVLLLRAETMSTHTDAPAGSSTVVTVEAHTKNNHYSADELELTQALVLTCRLQVNAELTSSSLRPLDDSRYGFTLRPALDESDRRQLHGCLEDMRIDHLQVTVLQVRDVLPS